MTEIKVIGRADTLGKELPMGRHLLSGGLIVVEPQLVDGRPTGRVCLGAWVQDGVREFVMVDPPG